MEEWNPPSEAEQRRLQLMRERSNKISKILGDYLLKGYKMLGSSCNKCQTILLEDRQGEDYCVGCVEIDCPASQDVTHSSSQKVSGGSSAGRQVSSQNLGRPANAPLYETADQKEIVDETVKTLFNQLKWVNEALVDTTSVSDERRKDYVVFIRTCLETLHKIRGNNQVSVKYR